MLKLKVREVAESQGITDPVALAAKAKIAYATAYRLMRDEIGDEKRGVGILVLYKVSRALGVPLMALLEETGPMELSGAAL
jgi:hypothetical protein